MEKPASKTNQGIHHCVPFLFKDKIMKFLNNATIFSITKDVPDLDNPQLLASRLKEFEFKECGTTQKRSIGWGNIDDKLIPHLIFQSDGKTLIRYLIEEKILPTSVIKRVMAQETDKKEKLLDRPLRKTEKDALKDDICARLLPQAFSKYSTLNVIIFYKEKLIVIDTASVKQAENALSLLRKTIGSLPVTPLIPRASIEGSNLGIDLDAILTSWVKDQTLLPAGFTILDELEMHSLLEDGGIIKCKKENLSKDEIQNHLTQDDKIVTKLALRYKDLISFNLLENYQFKNIKFDDSVFTEAEEQEDKRVKFDTEFVLATSNLIEAVNAIQSGISEQL